MQSKNPRISIIISAHDRRGFVSKAVKSVLDQKCPQEIYEIIVVKNFMDDSVDRFLSENHVISLFTEEKPLSRKIIKGLEAARGSVISFLDDDDEFTDQKVGEVEKIFRDDRVVFYHNGYYPVDATGKKIRTREKMRGMKAEAESPDEFAEKFPQFLGLRADWYMSMISMRRYVLEKYIQELRGITASIDKFLLYISVNEMGKIIADSRELTRYRVHSSLTNFTEPLGSFASRKSDFYRRSSETFMKLTDISKNDALRKITECVRKHEEVLADFHSLGNVRRRERIVDALDLLRCSRNFKAGSFYLWALAGLISAVEPELPLFFYHLLYDRELRRIFTGSQKTAE